jgi:hypothetical protein
MDSQRLLLAPRSFLYAVDEARAACGFRLAFANRTNPADADPRFFLNITDVSADRVMFLFLNTSPEDYAITHVYFDDGELMAINVLRAPANDPHATGYAGKQAATGGGISHRDQSLHENLAVTFDLRAGIGMADIVCALNAERLKVSLKAVRQDNHEVEIFSSEPVLSLSQASVSP